jgi:hypothetical protein
MLYADRSSKDEQRLLLRKKRQKEKNGGRLKVKIQILFYGDNS